MAKKAKKSEFRKLRESVGLGRNDLALSFLKVSMRTLQRWDAEDSPEWAKRLMRYHDRKHCTAHGPEWEGFMFSRGKLVNKREGLAFSPDGLRAHRQLCALVNDLQAEIERARQKGAGTCRLCPKRWLG